MWRVLLAVGLTGSAVQFVLTWRATTDSSRRPWPPSTVSGRFGLYWLLVMTMAGSFFGLVATTGSLYPVGVHSVAGGMIFLAGATLNVLVADEFETPDEILGLEWRLHRTGPFAYSRHPNVIGHAGAVLGLAIAAGSWQTLVVAGAIVGWFVTKPHAEEPVLAARFEDRYARYRATVDRYVDWQRVSRALGRCPSGSIDC